MQGEGQQSGAIIVKETTLCSVSGLDRTLSAQLSDCAPDAAAEWTCSHTTYYASNIKAPVGKTLTGGCLDAAWKARLGSTAERNAQKALGRLSEQR